MPLGSLRDAPHFDCAWYSRAMEGERVCGDTATAFTHEDDVIFVMADGLGHGPEAAMASSAACKLAERRFTGGVERVISEMHQELQTTVGASVGVGKISATGDSEYRAVGNVVVRREGGPTGSIRLNGKSGIVGGHRAISSCYEFNLGREWLVAYTDGIPSHCDLSECLSASDSAMDIARAIVRRYGKSYDDATCMVLRKNR